MCGIFVVIPKKENHDYFRAKIALDKLKELTLKYIQLLQSKVLE